MTKLVVGMERFFHFSHRLCMLIWLMVYRLSNKIAASSVFVGDPECYNTAGNRYAIYFVKNSYVDSRDSTYKQVICKWRQENDWCNNFTDDDIISCQQFSGKGVTLPFKKKGNYSMVRCEVKPMGRGSYSIKAIHLKNKVTSNSSEKVIDLSTRCHCIWSEILPDVKVDFDLASTETFALLFPFNFSNYLENYNVKVFLRTHSTKSITTKEICSYDSIEAIKRCELGELQPCNTYSLIFEINSRNCNNSKHTIEKKLPWFYSQNLHIDNNSFNCEKSDGRTVISLLHNSRIQKNFYYFLKERNQVVQNGSFDEKTITVYRQFDMKIKVCKYECICSDYVPLTCLQKEKQLSFINKILVLLGCIIVIIAIVTSCVKKAKNSKKTDHTPHHFTFDENDLDLKNNMFGKNDLYMIDIITSRPKEIFGEQKLPMLQSRRNSTVYEKVLLV